VRGPLRAVSLPTTWRGIWTNPIAQPGFAERLLRVWLTLNPKHYPEG
jgi:hypothetical protein